MAGDSLLPRFVLALFPAAAAQFCVSANVSETASTKVWVGCGTIKVPWYAWTLVPLVFCAGLVVGIPFIFRVLGFWRVPYYFVFPERRRQLWDYEGTTHQRMLLERWRGAYARLSFAERLGRTFKKRRFRKGR